MILRRLAIRQFRAHTESEFVFSDGINLIHGPNGVGKTNVVEAIHYLSIGRSFIASKDTYALQFGQPFFDLRATFEPSGRHPFEARIVFKPDDGKRAFVNGAPLDRLADLIGRIPTVVLAPGDIALTEGPPDERRRFLDNTLSQARPAYLTELLKYRRTMRQRNAVLSNGRYLDPALLAPWNAEFSKGAAHLTMARSQFVKSFNEYLDRAYAMMDAIGEAPSISYRPFAGFKPSDTFDEVVAAVEQKLRDALPRERDLRRSLVGPHRDELVFLLNDIPVRRYASQGQHRTFGMALQLAKYLYLKSMGDEKPLLLLDDVFGNPERHRASEFPDPPQDETELGQSIITGADDRVFLDSVSFSDTRHTSHEIQASVTG